MKCGIKRGVGMILSKCRGGCLGCVGCVTKGEGGLDGVCAGGVRNCQTSSEKATGALKRCAIEPTDFFLERTSSAPRHTHTHTHTHRQVASCLPRRCQNHQRVATRGRREKRRKLRCMQDGKACSRRLLIRAKEHHPHPMRQHGPLPAHGGGKRLCESTAARDDGTCNYL